MPELPEVETVRRMLEPAMQRPRFRRVIVNRPNLRIPFPDRFADRLRGTTVMPCRAAASTWSSSCRRARR